MIIAGIELSAIGTQLVFPLIEESTTGRSEEKVDPTELLSRLIFEYEELAHDYGVALRAGIKDGCNPIDAIMNMVEEDEISRRIVIEFQKYNIDMYDVDYNEIVPMLLAA